MKIDKIITSIENFESILEKEEFNFIRILAEKLIEYKTSIEASLISNSSYTVSSSQFSGSVRNILNDALKSFSSVKIGGSLQNALNLIEADKDNLPIELVKLMETYHSQIISLLEEIDNFKFRDKLNSFQNIYSLGYQIHVSKMSIASYKTSLSNFKTLMSHQYEPKENERILEISFYSDNILLQAHALISAMLDIIYNELCSILNIPSNEYPLKIIIVHSGSDDFTLLGNSKVFSFLELVLSNSGKYFYENYTKDGEFKKLSAQFNDIANKLKIMKELELLGIDVSESNESLQKSLLYIARALEDNLRFQYKMEINGNEYKIIPDDKRPQIAYQPKQIEYKPLDIRV
ncbi:MAG: hypothetical protein KA146_06990 [Leptospiraceae bacterium]|nr:hypothetical protein [Leptospiraceae bacterium]